MIEESMQPYFTLESEDVWEKTEETKGTDKIASCRYTITNTRGDISDLLVLPETYIYFALPTDVENKFYIFKYRLNNFNINHKATRYEEEKGKKFVFL